MTNKIKQKSKILLEHIVHNIPQYVFWKDTNSVYVGCNDNYAKLIGLRSAKEIIGKTDLDIGWLPHGDSVKLFRQGDLETIHGKYVTNQEEWLSLPNGIKILALVNKSPIINEDGEVLGVLGIATDITARKQQEEEVRQAKVHAEAASRAKSEFLENMRHDIRTPLAGITGFANILRDEAMEPKIKEYAENIVASSAALQEFLNEILEAVRVTSGDIPLLKSKFDLKKRLCDVVSLNQAKAKQKCLELVFDCDADIPAYLIGDGKRIQKIVLELVANALNFTDKGSVKVMVRLAKKQDRDVIVKITVADTGIGIPYEKQQEIFAQFKRLTPSYEGIYKGAGLGLAVIKQFINDLDGEIYVDSEVNKGSTFTCIIPLREALLYEELGMESTEENDLSQVKQNSMQQQVRAKEVLYKNASNVTRILLVEDNVVASKMALHILSQLNCEIDHASNGQTAVTFAKQHKYDLIFMDVGLPDMSGLEVTKRIRLENWNNEIQVPIIALTAHVEGADKQRCIEAGMNAVLSKPLVKDTAKDILNAFIPQHPSVEPESISNLATINGEIKSHLLTLNSVVLDRASGLQLAGGNEDLLKELLSMLIDSFPEELEQLRTARQQDDWEAVRAVAHKLKGGATYCGALRLREACTNLDSYLRAGAQELNEALYQQMLDEMEQLKKQQ